MSDVYILLESLHSFFCFAYDYTIFWTNLSNLYHCYFMRNAISLCPCLSEDNQRHPSISESFVSRVAVLSEFLYMTSFHMTFNSVTHFFGWHVIKSLKMRQNELPHCQQTLKKSSSLQIRDQICVVHITMTDIFGFLSKKYPSKEY